MRILCVLFSLLVLAGCEKYDGSLSLPPPDDGGVSANATLRGRVSADGVGLSNVYVSLHYKGGKHITKTNDGGYYIFTNLNVGEYIIEITNPNKDVFSFNSYTQNISVEVTEDITVNFTGTYIGPSLSPNEPIPQPAPIETLGVIISGVVFEDANGDSLHNGGEKIFSNVNIGLYGNETRLTKTGPDGRYTC